jgi:hypothetical protein
MDESNQEAPRADESPTTEAPASEPRAHKARFNYIGIGSLLAVTALIGGLQYFGVVDFRSISAPGLAVSALDPDNVLATVNGSEITQGEVSERLEQIENVLRAQGADLTQTGVLEEYKTRILDELIDTELLRQAATESGVTATAEAVDAEFQELLTMFGGEEALDGQLEIVGMTREQLMDNLKEQKLIEAFVATKADINNIEVTDAEIRAFYDQSIAGADPANVPPFEEVQDLLRQQVSQDKAAEMMEKVIAQLKADAAIVKN